jgi:hypothetical protein
MAREAAGLFGVYEGDRDGPLLLQVPRSTDFEELFLMLLRTPGYRRRPWWRASFAPRQQAVESDIVVRFPEEDEEESESSDGEEQLLDVSYAPTGRVVLRFRPQTEAGAVRRLARSILKPERPVRMLLSTRGRRGPRDEEPLLEGVEVAMVSETEERFDALERARGGVVDDAFADDRGVVVEAVRSSGGALRHASARLRADPEVVLEAVRTRGSALRHAHERLRGDRGFVVRAVRQDSDALKYADERLRRDRGVVLEAVRSNGFALRYADAALQSDRGMVMEAVRSNGFALRFADRRLRKDPDLALQAVLRAPRAIKYVDESIREDVLLLAAR